MTFIGPALPAGEWRSRESDANDAPASTSGQSHSKASRGAAPVQWAHRQRAGAGLRNLGNTCYLNSVLQCLTHTPPLAKVAQELGHTSTCTLRSGACAFCLVETHMRKSLEQAGGLTEPKDIYRKLRSFAPSFHHGRQEDAHELLRVAIEAMHQSCMTLIGRTKDGPAALGPTGAYAVPPTVIENIFGGVLQSQVRCLACGYESNTYEPLMDLSLEVHNQIQSVQEALRKMTHVERLSGANAYKCDRCNKLVTADKQMTLHRTPNCLVVHLKRFANAHGGKIQTHIRFDEALDLSTHLSGGSVEQQAHYRLYGVLVHAGFSASSGHYYCFAKDAFQWHQFDDSQVSQAELQAVLREGAYMLFYARTTPSPPLDTVSPRAAAAAAAAAMAPADVYHASAPIGPSLPSPRAEAAATARAGGEGGSVVKAKAEVKKKRHLQPAAGSAVEARAAGGGNNATSTALGKRKAEEAQLPLWADAEVGVQRMMATHHLRRLAELSAVQRFTVSTRSGVGERARAMAAGAAGQVQPPLARLYGTVVANVSHEWRRKMRELLRHKRKEGAKWGDAVSPESLELLKGQAGVVLPKAELGALFHAVRDHLKTVD